MENKARNMSLQHVENSKFGGLKKKTSSGRLWKATKDFGGRGGLAIITIFIIKEALQLIRCWGREKRRNHTKISKLGYWCCSK